MALPVCLFLLFDATLVVLMSGLVVGSVLVDLTNTIRFLIWTGQQMVIDTMSRSSVLDTLGDRRLTSSSTDVTLFIVPDGGERYKPTHPGGLQHVVADLPAMKWNYRKPGYQILDQFSVHCWVTALEENRDAGTTGTYTIGCSKSNPFIGHTVAPIPSGIINRQYGLIRDNYFPQLSNILDLGCRRLCEIIGSRFCWLRKVMETNLWFRGRGALCITVEGSLSQPKLKFISGISLTLSARQAKPSDTNRDDIAPGAWNPSLLPVLHPDCPTQQRHLIVYVHRLSLAPSANVNVIHNANVTVFVSPTASVFGGMTTSTIRIKSASLTYVKEIAVLLRARPEILLSVSMEQLINLDIGYNTISQNTNVVELYNQILKESENANQLTFYSSGIGTYVPSTAHPRLRGCLLGTITQLTRQLQGSILSGLFCVIPIVLKCQEFHGDHRKGVSLIVADAVEQPVTKAEQLRLLIVGFPIICHSRSVEVQNHRTHQFSPQSQANLALSVQRIECMLPIKISIDFDEDVTFDSQSKCTPVYLLPLSFENRGGRNRDGIFDRVIGTGSKNSTAHAGKGTRNKSQKLVLRAFLIESHKGLSRMNYNFYTTSTYDDRLSSKDRGYTSTSSQDKRQRTRHIETIKSNIELPQLAGGDTSGMPRVAAFSEPLAFSRILVVISREETHEGSNGCEEIQEQGQELEERQRETEQR
ncbi:hypothetical protein ARMSODRAFT_1051935 [Armillaria solidipes]|uniref:Uncharacterized protein n=1 Tax=Armillaria solidipes TaxID=1076256 RepID=A0A2H3BLY4_9AGAR|nr:hypothetical protein ARMSODRAFT_1051935 [Armillaria solidipes]